MLEIDGLLLILLLSVFFSMFLCCVFGILWLNFRFFKGQRGEGLRIVTCLIMIAKRLHIIRLDKLKMSCDINKHPENCCLGN